MKNHKSKEDKNHKNIEDKNLKIISLNEKMIYLKKQIIDKIVFSHRYLKQEFVLPIYHYKIIHKKYLFRNFNHIRINEFPIQFIIMNSGYNLSAKNLYEYIWNLNKLYINHPNIDTKDFWWNQINSNKINSFNNKLCYPFVLRYIKNIEDKETNSELFNCTICPWYSFCPGCIIDPRGNLTWLSSDMEIVVDWCNDFVEEEICSENFQLIKDIDNNNINENLPSIYKNNKGIKDCFDLFLKGNLIDNIQYCKYCRTEQNFNTKNYINRFPYVFILCLDRFKFKKYNNYKIEEPISFPLYDFELNNKKYDLFGTINHISNKNSGHYTSIIKDKENKWILCDDNNISEIEEKNVINSNAYLLFYINKESPYNYDYYKMMKSFMNNIDIIDKKNKKFKLNKDMNYFKYEPVEIKLDTKNNIGYVMKENIENFSNDDKEYDDKENNKKEKYLIMNYYYKNFVRVKLDFCDGWINKCRIKKILFSNKNNN